MTLPGQVSAPGAARSFLSARSLVALLWCASILLTGALAVSRFHGAQTPANGQICTPTDCPSGRPTPIGSDFDLFLLAGGNISRGLSPYTSVRIAGLPGLRKFTYPPTLAWILAPFAHTRPSAVWDGWLVMMMLTLVLALAAFVYAQRPRLRGWQPPLLLALCAVTLLIPSYYPLSRDLLLGQSDTIVLALVGLSTLATVRSRPTERGVWLAVAALMKAWPVMFGLCLLQRGVAGRRRAIAAMACVGTAGSLAMVAAAGQWWPGGFVGALLAPHQHKLVSDSVSTISELLFSNSGLARPLLVSDPLRVAVTLIAAAWVIALLAVALSTRCDPTLCTWHVTFLTLLLLPFSHRQYALLGLPILWFWIARFVRQRPASRGEGAVLALLVLWWLIQNFTWPYNGSPHSESALAYSVPFVADLAACTVSVVGAWLFLPRYQPTA